MGLLIFLIAIAVLTGLILGPIGLIKAQAAGHRLGKLEQQFQRIAIELNDTRAICFKLRADLRDATRLQARDEQPDTATAAAEEPTRDEAVSDAPDQAAPNELEATPNETEPTTLEVLRAYRLKQQTRSEQAGDADDATEQPEQPEQPLADQPEPSAETREPLVEQAAAIESIEQTEPEAIAATTAPPRQLVSQQNPAPAETNNAPARRLTIEEVLAGKVFVWIGAIALVLTAAFLLKLGFDENIITIPVRVIGAGVFGLALWCVGEWARHRVSLIAQALCGAAVAVLYGTIIAAQHYELLGTGHTLAFGLMGLVTAAAVALSLRHGPAVAILGMLGGFMLPPLLTQDFGPTSGMILYLLAIEVGVLAVTGKRGWFGISAMTLIFTLAWSIGYTIIGDDPHERTLTAMLVLGTAGAYLFHTARIHRDPHASKSLKMRVLGLSIAATCSAIGIVALLVVKGGYELSDLRMLGLVALGTLVLARIDARHLAMPFVAMGLSLMVLFANAAQSLAAPPSSTFITLAACFGGLFTLGGYLCLWRNEHRRAFAILCAIAGPTFYGLVMFAGYEAFGYLAAWWPYSLGLAGLYALATVPMLLKRKAEYDWPIALFAVLSFALVCVTLGQALNHPWLAVCLALISAVAALIDLRLYIRPLRIAATLVAFGSAALLIAPGPFDLTIAGSPVFNTLLPMYALPALAFAIIAWCASKAGSHAAAHNLTYLCIGTLGAMLLVLTRDIFHPTHFAAKSFHLYEWSTYATVLLLAAHPTYFLAQRLGFKPIRDASTCLLGIGGVLALIAGIAPSNPLYNGDGTGGWQLALGLFALYIVPAALCWHGSMHGALAEQPQLKSLLRGISITLAAIFAGLQIRNGFQPDNLRQAAMSLYECVTYAAVAITLGGAVQQLDRYILKDPVTRTVGRVVFALGVIITLIGSVFVFNPLLDTDAQGGWRLLVPLVVLYVVPALLLWLWSRGKTLADQTTWVASLRMLSIAFVAIFVGQLIRNGFHHDNLRAFEIGAFECATYGLAWVLLGFGFHTLSPRCTLPQTTGQVGRTVFGLGLITLLLGNAVVLNPLWFRVDVGPLPVLNGLWYLFGPLLIILLLLARHARQTHRKTHAQFAGYLTLALAFMLLSTFVRHGFADNGFAVITSGLVPAERYAYSLAWVIFGGVLLIAGVFTRLDTLRYGSLAVLLLAVGKVFLIDTANLEDLYRVFSFFGLGVTLIALGYLYQRLVFKRPAKPTQTQAA